MNNKKLTQRYSAKIGSGDKRELVFLANSGKPMADGSTVDLDSLTVRDPDSGSLVAVKDLKESDSKNFVALLTDHSWSVAQKAGQVRGLWLTDEGLMARANLANTELGENLLTLAKDDMLDTFSITVGFTEQPGDDGVIHNAQLLEISAVWLGNDETTQLKSVNDRKETAMPVSANMTKEEADDLIARLDELKEAVGAMADEGDGDKDTPTEDTPVEPSENSRQVVNNFINVQKNEREAKTNDTVKQIEVQSNAKGYLASNQALKDFARCIVENKGRGDSGVMTAWSAYLKANGITGEILPTSIEDIFFKTWTDSTSILSTFRNSNARQLDLYAWTQNSTAEDIRAKGHKKGEQKQNQNIKPLTRTTRVKGIYKKLPIDLQDLVDDTTGELTRFRAQELADRVANEIVVGAILGDGRSSATPDLRVFDGTRGLYPMAEDIAGSGTATSFDAAVATEITATATDTLYTKYMKVLGAVRTAGRKVLIVPFGAVTELLTSTKTDGQPIFGPGITSLEQIFPNTRVFELDEMVGGDYTAIAYAEGAYVLNGDSSARVFTDFDLNYNQDVMEVVRYVGGSLNGRKVAAGIKEAGE